MTFAPDFPSWLTIHPEVLAALQLREPVVALESTVITHGLPQPINLDLARSMEAEVRAGGALPATVALLKGSAYLGLTSDQLHQLAISSTARKVSRADFGFVRAMGLDGGTTVAGTMIAAHAAGVRIFATGGIGGVHRGSQGDISADLSELARTPVGVICAGAKSILDLPRTLEWLETAGVPVIGWRSDEFPAFFSRSSGLPLSLRVNSALEAARVLAAHWELGLQSGALVCVPCPAEQALDRHEVAAMLSSAEQEAAAVGVQGKQLTPFLLSRLAQLSAGRTLRANLALLKQNAAIAAQIAVALNDLLQSNPPAA